MSRLSRIGVLVPRTGSMKEGTMTGIAGPVAFVTGASRGIGKAVAIAFAQAGYDVAITARSQVEGEEREHSSTVRSSNTAPLPGSLAATAEAITDAGRA